MSELRNSWTQAALEELTIPTEQVEPLPDATFTYIDIGSVDRQTKRVVSPQVLLGKDAPSRARKLLCQGDTLVSMTRPNLNAVALVGAEHDGHIASTGFDVLRSPGLDPRWIAYLVRTSEFVTAMSDLVQGALYPAVSSKHVRAFVAPVAPRNEQTRIADKLDAVLTRVDACRERLNRIPAILKRFRQSVLAAATTGKLTEEWRTDTGCLSEWQKVCLNDVIVDVRNGMAPKPTETPPGAKILRISAVRSGRLDLADHRYLVVTDKDAAQYSLQKHDLLFTRYNGSLEFVGVCASLKHDAKGYVYPDKLIRVRVKESMAHSEFIEIVFGSEPVRRQIETFIKSSAGQKGISGADLKSTRFTLPSLSEQTEIVRRVESLFANADRLEARTTAARAQVERLTPSLLAKAFRGELVQQERSDEPASALLQRIRAQRGDKTTIKPKRGRKGTSV